MPEAGKTPVTKADVLNSALAAVADRGLSYGSPEDNFQRIADLWNAYLVSTGILTRDLLGDVSTGITAADVAVMSLLLKVGRLANKADHLDSWTDIAGYAACGAQTAGCTK